MTMTTHSHKAWTDKGGHVSGTARPLLHHPLWSGHAPQRPADVPAVAQLAPSGLERHPFAVGQTIPDHLKPCATAVFHGDHEVGVALFEVAEKGRFALSASACTSTTSSSTWSSSWPSAAISPPARVA